MFDYSRTHRMEGSSLDLDEPEGYSPMHEHTRLLSDGRHFYQVSSSPPFLDSSFGIGLDLACASLAPTIPSLTTPTLAVPAVAVAPPAASDSDSDSDSDSAGAGAGAPPAQADADTEAETTTQSDRAARAHIAAYIRSVAWYQGHAMEPRVGEAGMPACALQLAREGESIWACFVQRVCRRGIGVYKCVGCGHVTSRRNRAIGHQRAEWEHKPFACVDRGCDFRASTIDSVTDHRSPRTGTVACSACNEAIVKKNMSRHVSQVHGH